MHPRLASPQRVLIVRLGSMGDVIHALPAVAMLRQAFPEAQIGWAIEPRWSALLSAGSSPLPRSPQQPLLDRIHLVDTRGWRRSLTSRPTWRDIRAAYDDLRRRSYDMAIDFQGAWKSALLALLSGAPHRVGFRQPREGPAVLFYSQAIIARGRHIVEQNISLAGALMSSPALSQKPCFPLPHDPAAEAALRHRLPRQMKDFVILNPGAGWGAKCWPAERYAAVARALAGWGLSSLINCGPGEEALAMEVEQASAGAAQPIPCSLTELIELTRHARIFVGGDTGPMHLAAALGVPVVALFGPTDPSRNGPFATPNVVLRSSLSTTSHTRRPAPDEGLLSIAAEDVIAAAQRLLRETGAPHV